MAEYLSQDEIDELLGLSEDNDRVLPKREILITDVLKEMFNQTARIMLVILLSLCLPVITENILLLFFKEQTVNIVITDAFKITSNTFYSLSVVIDITVAVIIVALYTWYSNTKEKLLSSR